MSRAYSLAAKLIGVLAVAAILVLSGPSAGAREPKTLRFIPYADLSILDPHWTSGIVTRNYAFMVFDTLFAYDHNFKPQPQMVASWTESPDHLVWEFTLRDGLKFHDGTPVRGIDCALSLKRWGQRNGSYGQPLLAAANAIEAIDDKRFRISLKKPFPVLDALATLSTPIPFILPERLARTDPFDQIHEAVGSGPFKFVAGEFVAGHKAVFVKNEDYVSRKEPADGAAGAKIVNLDRVEWIYIPDATTASQALMSGEVDRWEYANFDLLPLLRQNKDIEVAPIFPIGNTGALRFNQLQPPFNNLKMRQAVMAVADQREYMEALAGPQENWNTCFSFYACGFPIADEVGAEPLKRPRDPELAKKLIAESGYKGEKIVLMTAVDYPVSNNQSMVTYEMLKKLGLNIELVSVDWGTLLKRRTIKDSVDKGGWSIFHTTQPPFDGMNPANNYFLRANGPTAYPGWPQDDELEKRLAGWFDAAGPDAQHQVADAVQRRAFESVPYIPTGQFFLYTAYRKSVTGRIPMHVPFMWGLDKAE
ncbi:MAG TPA: ABC transporter substrate-binding protein [Stellaceae bacterium]|jgi:peptide/nickel transport system substrate-binding protein|nr:ABC transporter substrate-binding protein [Stellaceae bacterium]